MSKRKCGLCGADPADGLASVTQHGVTTYFCHDDDDVTCYERQSWRAEGSEVAFLEWLEKKVLDAR